VRFMSCDTKPAWHHRGISDQRTLKSYDFGFWGRRFTSCDSGTDSNHLSHVRLCRFRNCRMVIETKTFPSLINVLFPRHSMGGHGRPLILCVLKKSGGKYQSVSAFAANACNPTIALCGLKKAFHRCYFRRRQRATWKRMGTATLLIREGKVERFTLSIASSAEQHIYK